MTRMKQAIGLALLLGGTCIFMGCSKPTAEESKPMKDGDGTSQPTATGAGGAGGAGGNTAPATAAGKASSN